MGYFLDRQWDDIDQPRKVRKRNHGKYYYQTTSDGDATSSDDQTIKTCAKGILIALQFRFVAKILCKALAKRIETVLPSIINTDQNGFVLNRQAFHNTRRLLNIIFAKQNGLGKKI